MAKKVRSRPEATEESKFEFPVFDERAFIRHELSLTTGSVLAIGWALLAAVLSSIISLIGGGTLHLVGAASLGLLVVVSSGVLFPRIDRDFATYTRGDWASVFLLEIFAWLGIWLLLAGAFGHLTS